MIVYSNSCSFGAPDQGHIIYPEVVADAFSATIINDGLAGSCNRRIIRTSLRQLINLQKDHNQEIIALIGLTFLSRTELWQPWLPPARRDGDFHPISNNKILAQDWSNGVANTINKNVADLADDDVKDYYKQWLLHYSKESAVTDLITDIIMLNGYAVANNINMLIFSNCQLLPGLPDVDVNSPFLKNFAEYTKTQDSILDPWSFSFRDFALDAGYYPKDKDIYGLDGHPGEDAHVKFGKLIRTHITHNV